MSTHRSRSLECARTLAQLDRMGVWPTVFVDDNPSPNSAGNRRNGERVLTWARSLDADLLFLEDDIDVAPDFPAALAAAREVDAPVTFWLDQPHQHPEWDRVGFYPLASTLGWRGSQALLLPLSRVQRACGARAFGDGLPPPIDIFLKHTGALDGLLVALPNPVQHRSPASVVDPRRPVRVSPTFGLPRVGDWSTAWRARTT
jgi:hypothetical protein